MDDGTSRISAWKDSGSDQGDHPAGRPMPFHNRRGAFRLGALAGLTMVAMATVDRDGGGVTPCGITGGPYCCTRTPCTCGCHKTEG